MGIFGKSKDKDKVSEKDKGRSTGFSFGFGKDRGQDQDQDKRDRNRDKEPEAESEAALLRRLAQEKQQEKKQEEQQKQVVLTGEDKLWADKRAEFGPLLVTAAKAALMRRARGGAQRGELSLTVDLGVNEARLRISSTKKELNLAEAALAPKATGAPDWDFVERLGWLLQTPDGLQPSESGRELLDELRQAGFTINYTPFYVKDHYANPYFNATLELRW